MDLARAVAVSPCRTPILVAALLLTACRPPTDFIEPSSNRPTSVDGTVYRAYGDIDIQLHRTSDGCCTIWYVEEGEHAIAVTDDDLPERVRLVEQTAADVFAWLDHNGWRRPAPDSILPPVTEFGDSANLDIYLVNFVRGDGMWVEEYCTRGRRPICTGFLAMHNAPSESYTSEQEGVEVLVSHELFHAVQAAYTSELPRWFSEGTATLAEELVYPDQSDFERLCGHYFEHPGRSLNDPEGGFDGFSYSTALFFQFLQQHLPDDYLQRVLERSVREHTVEAAMVREAGGQHVFADLFARFSALTWLTGDRAAGLVADDLLVGARDYPAYPLPERDVEEPLHVEPWASVAVLLPGISAPAVVALEGDGQGVRAGRLMLVDLDASAATIIAPPARVGEPVDVPAGTRVLAIVANGAPDAALTARLRLVQPAD